MRIRKGFTIPKIFIFVVLTSIIAFALRTGTEASPSIRTCKPRGAECKINNSTMSCCSGLYCVVSGGKKGVGKCVTIPTPTPLPTFCVDTDNGSYNIVGSCTDSFGTHTDYCDGTTAREMYCSGTWNGSTWTERHCNTGGYVCSSAGKICQNGACVSP